MQKYRGSSTSSGRASSASSWSSSVIAVGLQPERLMPVGHVAALPGAVLRGRRAHRRQRRDGVRDQSRLGVDGCTRQRRCAGRLHHRRQVRARLGHHRPHPDRHPARRAGAGAGIRGQRHAGPDEVIPIVTDLVAVLADRRGRRTHHQYGGHRHRIAQPVAGHVVGRRSTRSRRSWARRSTGCRGCRSRSTTATRAWRSC